MTWQRCPYCMASVDLKRDAYPVVSVLWTNADHLAANGHSCRGLNDQLNREAKA